MNQFKISSFWKRITQQLHSLWKKQVNKKKQHLLAEFEWGNTTNPSDLEGIPSISRKLFMLKGKSCTDHILSSLDLQGIEALMRRLVTEVGKALMDASNRIKNLKIYKHTRTFLNLLNTHLSSCFG